MWGGNLSLALSLSLFPPSIKYFWHAWATRVLLSSCKYWLHEKRRTKGVMLYNMYTPPKMERVGSTCMFAPRFGPQGKEGTISWIENICQLPVVLRPWPIPCQKLWNWVRPKGHSSQLVLSLQRVCCPMRPQMTSLLSFESDGGMTLRNGGKEKM